MKPLRLSTGSADDPGDSEPARVEGKRGYVVLECDIRLRRLPNGARDRSPDGLPFRQREGELGAGLIFESGVRIVLEFRSHGERKRISESDFVLNKCIVKIVSSPGRTIALGVSGCCVVAGNPVAQAPYEVVP